MGFFKPAWQSKDYEKALKAVLNEADEIKLAFIAKAKGETFIGVRKAAVKRLSDQNILTDIATNGESDIKYEAKKRLNDLILLQIKTADQNTLINFVKKVDNSSILKEIIKRLTDQKTLSDLAKSEKHAGVRLLAAEKLIDNVVAQEIIFKIAMMINIDVNLREEAVWKITAPQFLIKVEKNANHEYVREAAKKKRQGSESGGFKCKNCGHMNNKSHACYCDNCGTVNHSYISFNQTVDENTDWGFGKDTLSGEKCVRCGDRKNTKTKTIR